MCAYLAPSAHDVGGGPLASGLFLFRTAFSCRRRRVARRRGGGGGVRRDDRCCDVPREVEFRRPRDRSSGARELRDGGWLDKGIGADALVLGVSLRL